MEKEAGADGDGDDSTHTIPPWATRMSLSPSESNRAGNDLSLRAVEPVNVCVSNLTASLNITKTKGPTHCTGARIQPPTTSTRLAAPEL